MKKEWKWRIKTMMVETVNNSMVRKDWTKRFMYIVCAIKTNQKENSQNNKTKQEENNHVG